MKDEPAESRKSVAVSIMSQTEHEEKNQNDQLDDEVQSRVSIALSVNPDKILQEQNRIIDEQKQAQEQQDKMIEEEKQRQLLNKSKKSIALSAYPDGPISKKSRKSLGMSVNSEKIKVDESRKSIALS